MPLFDLLLSSPPSLSEQLKRRIDDLRSTIIRANYNTQFAQTAPELTDFRRAVAGSVDQIDNNTLSELFQKMVPFTSYESYKPFLTRFFDKPCKASAVTNLLVPGFPDFLGQSSSTSGRLAKTIPKYNRLSIIRSPNTGPLGVSDLPQQRTTAFLRYLDYDRIVVEDEDNCPVKTIYLSIEPSIKDRTTYHLDPEEDEARMATFILDHTAPYAVSFIKRWRSFLLMHALFTVCTRSLETINVVFLNTFVELIRHLDEEFDTVVDCVANGTVPDLDGIANVRHHLEPNILPNPERAAELRQIGRPSSLQGWCSRVWPNLRSVISTCSGSFAQSIPLAQWFLGPDAKICALGYGSTECFMGPPYSPLELNQFKLSDKDIIELLDISKSDSTEGLAQLWEVEVGNRYEPIVTTEDGMWRYRLGDVVEVSGFDPTDGVPIVQFIERNSMVLRFQDFMFTEKELRTVVSSVALNMQITMANWTAVIDARSPPETIGFFIELAGEQVSDLARVPECLLDALFRLNENVEWALAHDTFRKPTIRVVRSGTFSEFLQLKINEGGTTGQIKVPVVLPKAAYVTWFADRVVQEF